MTEYNGVRSARETMWIELFEHKDISCLIAQNLYDEGAFQPTVRRLAVASKRMLHSQLLDVLVQEHVKHQKVDMYNYADFCKTACFLRQMMRHRPEFLTYYERYFQRVSHTMPFMHDFNTSQETHTHIRHHISHVYKVEEALKIMLDELERESTEGETYATKDHAMQFLHRTLYMMDGSLKLLVGMEELNVDEKERLCVAVAKQYHRMLPNAANEISAMYIMETLCRVYISQTLMNAIIHRFCNAAAHNHTPIATFLHGVIVRTARNTCDPYALGRYIRDNEIVSHVFTAYISQLSHFSADLHTCYISVIFAIFHSSRNLHTFNFEVQVQFQIIFTYVLSISEYLAGQVMLLCLEFLEYMQPPINLTGSVKIFVREIWHAVQRFNTSDIEILGLKCLDKITQVVQLQPEDWQFAGFVIAKCATPMWNQASIHTHPPLQSAAATRVMCTKMYMRAVKSLDYNNEMAPMVEDVLKHLIFVFQYVDSRGPVHTLQELRLGLALLCKFRFDTRKIVFVKYHRKIVQLQRVFAVFCTRVTGDLPSAGGMKCTLCIDIAYYLMNSISEYNSEAQTQFLMLCIHMSKRRLSSRSLHKIYRLFLATASETSLCQVQEHLGCFLDQLVKNRCTHSSLLWVDEAHPLYLTSKFHFRPPRAEMCSMSGTFTCLGDVLTFVVCVQDSQTPGRIANDQHRVSYFTKTICVVSLCHCTHRMPQPYELPRMVR